MPGHEIVGRILAVGDGVMRRANGDPVGVVVPEHSNYVEP